jgi:hypothetical protein
MKSRVLPTCLLTLLAACGGGGGGGGDDDGPGGGDSDGGGDPADDTDAGPDADGFVPLLTVDWTLQPPDGPNPDKYWCASVTLTQDIIVTGFRSISPPGTHHLVVSIGAPDGADDPGFECEFFANHNALLFASGVGTDDFLFPDGVGVRLVAGQQLFLNAHTFNASEETISGASGVSVLKADSVETEAEFTLAGPIFIGTQIAGDGAPHEISGTCTVGADGTILNWWPHMHQMGTHMKVSVEGDVVHDENFTFTEQINYPTERQVQAGDQIDVTCTYVNDTGESVSWGDSSNNEMCFVGFYRYPKIGDAFCTD